MIAAPHEQAGQVQAVIGVQVRQQDRDRSRVGKTLQRAQDTATEVDDQRWRIRCRQEVTRRR
ncbi:Uncharacterised protein [Mycobacteroides abscessus subsp. abscessus]|nr:Uncharacterised protein [Mycobacteroides abscessus subsp. abscessus]